MRAGYGPTPPTLVAISELPKETEAVTPVAPPPKRLHERVTSVVEGMPGGWDVGAERRVFAYRREGGSDGGEYRFRRSQLADGAQREVAGSAGGAVEAGQSLELVGARRHVREVQYHGGISVEGRAAIGAGLTGARGADVPSGARRSDPALGRRGALCPAQKLSGPEIERASGP